MNRDVKSGSVGPDPRADVGRTSPAAGGVDVDAADDAVAAAGQDGIGEARACGEVRGVPPQVGEVLFERQPRIGPPAVWIAGGGPDVVDARRPRFVVALVVLRPE